MSVDAVSVSAPPAVAPTHARSIYLLMAAVFVVVAVAGFAPRSIAILTGARPVPPLLIHVHAGLMSAWLLLFLAQALLIATGRLRLHRTIGVASFVVAPAVFSAMIALVAINYAAIAAAASAPEGALSLDMASRGVAFVLFIMGRAALLFGVFTLWAVLTRRSAPETHKRMMVMATLVLMDAALARMTWLPGSVADNPLLARSYDVIHLYQLLLMAPALVYDVIRFGRIHSAYWIGLGLTLPFAVATHLAWSSEAWQRAVRLMIGADG